MIDSHSPGTGTPDETARQFQAIVTHAADGILVVDTEGVVRFVNPAAGRLLGRSSAELLGSHLGQPVVVGESAELEVMRKDGSLTTVELRAAPVAWEGAPAVLASLRDVSDSIRARARIEHLNSVLRATRNINQLIVHQKDPLSLIQQTCDLLIEARGYLGAWVATGDGTASPKRFAQAGWGGTFQPCTVCLREGQWPPCWKECLAVEGTVTIRDPEGAGDGCSLSAVCSGSTVLATALRHDGSVLGQLGVSLPGGLAADDEERSLLTEVAADVALALYTIESDRLRREGEARFKVVTDSSPDAIFLAGEGSHLTYVNEAASKLLGHAADELMKMSMAEIVAPGKARASLQMSRRALGEGPHSTEAELVRKDGTTVPVDLSAVLLPNGEVYASCRDLTERRRGEEAVRRSEEQLKLAQRVAHIGHWELDAYDGTPVWSDEIFRIFGLEPGSASPSFTDLDTLIHPDEWPLLEEAVRAGFEEGEPFDLVFRILRPGPSLGWMHAIGEARCDDQGRVVKLFGTAQDVTERKQAELERREAEELFQLSFEHASIGKSLTLPDGTLSQVNQALCDLLGYTREELSAKEYSEVTHPDDLASSREVVRSLLANEKSHHRMEKRYLRKDGRTVWADVSSILLRRRDGTPRCFVTHVLDISDRKHAEEALRESRQLLEGILDAIPASVFWKDKDLVYLGCNSAFARDAGFAGPRDVIGKDDFQMGWRDQAESYRSDDREVIERGVPKLLFEEPQTTPTGDTITLLTSKLPLRSDTGEITGLLGTYVDITELKNLQAQLAQSDRLSSMGMLAAGVAHEINNPLTYILFNLESLSEDLPRYAAQIASARDALTGHLGEEQLLELLGSAAEVMDPAVLSDVQGRFSDALGGSRRIRDIAANLGSFARVDQEKVTPVDLRQPIESAINIGFNEIKYRATIVKEFDTDSTVLASEGKLAQVFLNLLINAAHAIPEGDVEHNRITIRTWQDGDEILAEVRDTGRGIPGGALERIFEPFFTTKPVGVGTGLGLSIVKSILTSAGGTIGATSEVGKGTRFLIRLPVATRTGSDAETVASSDPRVTGGAGRVLVIDDESGIRRLLKRILHRHEVVEAPSGEHGQRILAEDQRFDVILCDMMMPRVTGVDVHRWLLEHHPRLASKLVFVTGGAFTPEARRYFEGVGNPRIEKPFDAKDLRKKVGEWVEASRALG